MASNNKTILSIAIGSALGATAIASPEAAAVVLADGTYNVYVNTTPVGTGSTSTFYKFGKDGSWNSSFTYGGSAPSSGSFGLSDNSVLVTGSDSLARGSSVGGDGYAGHWVISVSGGSVNFVSFSSDTTLGTSLGDIAQYGAVTGGGTINQTTGAFTLTPTGRLAALSGINTLYDRPWYVDDVDCTPDCVPNGNTAWSTLTTGSATSAEGTVTINGAPVTALGDVDSDGLADYSAILVSGGEIGSQWGVVTGADFFEVKNIRLEFIAAPAAVPVPAGIWLFGSGLLGLGTLMWRKRKTESAIGVL